MKPTPSRRLLAHRQIPHFSPPRTIRWRNNATLSPSSSTINQDEIAHFSKLSSQWWDEKGEFGMLHSMNPIRMEFVRNKLVEIAQEDSSPDVEVDGSKVFHGLNVLDVGCGGGLFSESLTRMGANTLGIDASGSNIAIASHHALQDPLLLSNSPTGKGKGKLTYQHTSVEDLLSKRGPESFDVVCSMEVLEHVDNPRSFLDSCARLVKPGGHLFLSTISRTPLAYFLTIFAAENLFRLVEPGTHTHSKFVNPQELIEFFAQYRSSPPPALSHSPPYPPSSLESTQNEETTKSRPWITKLNAQGVPSRLEAETRGIMYLPWRSEWVLAPRGGGVGGLVGDVKKLTELCNYMFWVRKPQKE
ncbi:S-adenosyl-L-methionine-dependent methyltransferase [Abortiporus biennis]|nr:S-adenosyl-L-methionine-dependent methyltransferase [Abortiporus biennis]